MDESNDHMLSVWDWAKEAKVVDSKVGARSHPVSLGCPGGTGRVSVVRSLVSGRLMFKLWLCHLLAV